MIRSTSARPRARARALVLAIFAAGAAAAALAAAPQQQPVFRSSVDLIAVDVQVVDPEGNPIDQLGPGAFEVSIEGKKRRVISAEFVALDPTVGSPQTGSAAATPVSAGQPEGPENGRTIILAFDNGSFDAGSARGPALALGQFLQQLDPQDRVGLYVFPGTSWIPPTTQRVPLRLRLEQTVGERQLVRSFFNLKPFEIVDITAQGANPNSFLTQARGRGLSALDPVIVAELDPVLKVQRRECPDDFECPMRIYAEGLALAAQMERQVQLSLAGIESLLSQLADIPGRKTVVLLTGGLLVSDRPDGRPDAGDVAFALGQMAAQVNAIIYTVHIEANSPSAIANTASQRGSAQSELAGRDLSLYGNWLEAFSVSAGGRRLYVPIGEGGFAFERILRESAGYYLLGVEPQPADRDGRPHKLGVKVAGARRATVRSRQWVIVPQKGS
jgi:VWFA-related protein